MAADSILEILDGTTLLDLLRGPVRLVQDGWAPTVAPQRLSELGGLGSWADADERLPLQVVSTAAQNPGAAYTNLQRLLAQAARWARGEQAASPVRLRARPAGSRLSAGVALEAAVVNGRVGNLGETFFRILEGNATSAANAELSRRGAWLLPTSDEATTTPAASQQIQTLTFADHPTLSPLSLAITSTNGGSFAARGMVLVAPSASDFTIIEAESLAATGFASVASNLARGGAYASLDSTGAGTVQSAKATIAAVTRADIYVVIANDYETDLTVHLSDPQFETYSVTGASFGVTQLRTIIPTGSARPVFVGRVESTTPLTRLWLRMVVTTANEEAKIDSIIIHRDSGPRTGMLELYDRTNYRSEGTASALNVLTVLNTPLAYPAPVVCQGQNSAPWTPFTELAAYGDPALETSGTTLAVLPLLTQFPESPVITNPDGMFVPQTTVGGGTAITYRITARRQRAYLSLE
jgi:hypothetical protein